METAAVAGATAAAPRQQHQQQHWLVPSGFVIPLACPSRIALSCARGLENSTSSQMAGVAVVSYESGANLKLISKNLRPLFKSVPDSVFVCVGDTIETEEPDYLK